jgi:hypothetical protein
MVGVITSLDILAHPMATIRSFGWLVFFKAVIPWRRTPFLSLLRDAGFLTPSVSSLPTILERCIGLELRAKWIYGVITKALCDEGLVGQFFAGLAMQEQYHVDLLEVARAAAIRGKWRANLFNPWQDYLPRLEKEMEAAKAAMRGIDSIDAALRLVIQIESSEINQVFSAALAATDAAFVKKLTPFQKAMESHMSYIVERLPELSPKLMLACRELRARFPQVRCEPR